MPVSLFSDSRGPSARLYAEGFSVTEEEAESDLTALLAAGAIPLTLSEGGSVLSQGLGIRIEADEGPLLYLYALTTDRAARGRGLLRTLLRECAAMALRRGIKALCLLPADESLRAAYRRMGFTEELPAGGAPLVADKADLSLLLPLAAIPDNDRDALYEALGGHMTRAMFDYTLSTLSPAVIPARCAGAPALVLADDPRYALAAACPATRVGHHTLLAMPLAGVIPTRIPEPLPR